MTSYVSVARYHLVNRLNYLVLPVFWLAFAFVADLVVFALIPAGHHAVTTAHGVIQVPDTSGRYGGGLASVAAVFFALGVLSVARLPFALALGVSRRTYYAGTALLAAAIAAGYGLIISALQAAERASGGWGVGMHMFRVPYILSGPWYLTWLTAAVALALLFVYGMWFGIVYRRWHLTGLLAFTAAQVTVLLLAAVLITWSRAWTGTGHFFTALSAPGLTGLFAALAAALLAGGYVTIRRATI